MRQALATVQLQTNRAKMKLKTVYIKNFKGLEDIEVADCSVINAFVGKNNSGKSSILHAIDIASLAINIGNWDAFQPKLQIRDLINDAGSFEIKFRYDNDTETTVKSNGEFRPEITNRQDNRRKVF